MIKRIPLLVWFLAITILLAGVGVWLFSKNQGLISSQEKVLPAAVSNPVAGTEELEIVGAQHIAQGTTGSGYNSNPPTSGPHWPAAAKSGVYEQPLPDEQLIHNLEHGHVWISYKPDLSLEIKNKLAAIVQKDSWKVVLTPREKNDTPIVLVAWGRILKMAAPDYGKIKDFIRTYRNRGPEKTPA